MGCQSSPGAWNALLGACRTHRNIQLGKEAASKLIELCTIYVIIKYICRGRELEVCGEGNEPHGGEKGKKKEHAVSWIEIDNVIHSFGALNQLHPLKERLNNALEQLVSQMEDHPFY